MIGHWMNSEILSLLEGLQEYEGSMALLQTMMQDGFYELAQIRYSNPNGLYPEDFLLGDGKTRKLNSIATKIDEMEIAPRLPGTSGNALLRAQKSFEGILQQIMRVHAAQCRTQEMADNFSKSQNSK